MGPNRWSICTIQKQKGRRHKVLIERKPENRVVTRIHSIPPRIGELFYVRILLQHRPASSFEDLKTIHGRVYDTYQEAAKALGLFEDESEPVRAMREAVAVYSRPGQTPIPLCSPAPGSANTGSRPLGHVQRGSLSRLCTRA